MAKASAGGSAHGVLHKAGKKARGGASCHATGNEAACGTGAETHCACAVIYADFFGGME